MDWAATLVPSATVATHTIARTTAMSLSRVVFEYVLILFAATESTSRRKALI